MDFNAKLLAAVRSYLGDADMNEIKKALISNTTLHELIATEIEHTRDIVAGRFKDYTGTPRG